jgi:hypothetical protein
MCKISEGFKSAAKPEIQNPDATSVSIFQPGDNLYVISFACNAGDVAENPASLQGRVIRNSEKTVLASAVEHCDASRM